jgi:imidazole glycerol-phosphate synthase subunit HisH
MITIVDYGTSNVASVQNMLRKIGCVSSITSDYDEIAVAEKIILPGVGLFDAAITNLENLGLVELLKHKARVEEIPFLGICLGMQLLGESSEEGQKSGLGLIRAKSIKFNSQSFAKLKVPHMGWNTAIPTGPSALFDGYSEEPHFYFVHSYHLVCEDESDVLAESVYGTRFTSSVKSKNVLGVQFHPEKSHKYGMQLLKNFVDSTSYQKDLAGDQIP